MGSIFTVLDNFHSSPLHLFHWNYRGASSSLPDILHLARSYQVIYIQESFLLPSTNFNVPSFTCIRSDTSPGTRGLCTLIRTDYRFSLVGLNHLSHSSVEAQALLLYCSLDFPVLIINLYRPNSKTPSIFYSNLFAAVSASKYALIIGDFNAHHQVWGDIRVGGQRDAIVSACEAHNIIVLNDGLPTFISSSDQASSTIDLSIASRNFGLLASVSTLQDLYGSDHFPVSIFIANTSSSRYRFSNKFNLSDKQLASLYSRLSMDSSRFHSYISSSVTSMNPLQKYEKFCTFLSDIISLHFSPGDFTSKRETHIF